MPERLAPELATLVDLTELLRKSLGGRAKAAEKPAGKPAAKVKSAPPKKRA